MVPVVLVGIWEAAVVADRNLGLVGVDEDPGVTGRTATTITGDHPVVSPAYWLLVDELNRSSRLRLDAEVCLLKSGSGHGLTTRVLAPGPDLLSVGCLEHTELCILCDAEGLVLACGLWNGLVLLRKSVDFGFAEPGRGDKSTLAERRGALRQLSGDGAREHFAGDLSNVVLEVELYTGDGDATSAFAAGWAEMKCASINWLMGKQERLAADVPASHARATYPPTLRGTMEAFQGSLLLRDATTL